MLDKRKLKKHKRPKSGKTVFIYLLVLVVLSLIAYGYKNFDGYLQDRLSRFELSNINIEGNSIITDDEILKILGLKKGQKLLEISPNEVSAKLKKSSFIRSASAVYSLPATLRIKIEERKPVAFLMGRGLNLVDKEAFLLPVPEKNIRWNLPIITGIAENIGIRGTQSSSSEARFGVEIARFLNILEMPLRQMVSEIDFSNKNFIEIRLVNSSVAIKVTKSNYQDQLFVAAKYLRDYQDFDRIDKLKYIDVRFDGQIVIKEI